MVRSFGVETLDITGYYAWAIVTVESSEDGPIVTEISDNSLDIVDISTASHKKLDKEEILNLDPDVLFNIKVSLAHYGINAFEDSLDTTGDEVE